MFARIVIIESNMTGATPNESELRPCLLISFDCGLCRQHDPLAFWIDQLLG